MAKRKEYPPIRTESYVRINGEWTNTQQLEQLPHQQRLVALAFVEGLLAQMQIEASEHKKKEVE